MARHAPFVTRALADDDIRVEVDGTPIVAQRGIPLAFALLAAGLGSTSRSAKYRRPRGPYCLDGDCGSCLVRIDGRPNQRSCMCASEAGMQVESQNTVGPAALDPTRLVDLVFRGGLDHHHLMVKPRLVNQIMQGVARELTGFGELPSADEVAPMEHEHRRVAVLIVGAGPAGRTVAERLAAARIDHLLVDRHEAPMLAAAPFTASAPLLPAAFLARTGVFGAYPDESLWAAARELPGGGRSLLTVEARHAVLATGAREAMIPLANNDLPGVFAARGLLRQLRRASGRLAARCVVIGAGDHAERCRRALDDLRAAGTPEIERLDPDAVVALIGKQQVTGVQLADRRVAADLVALAPTPSPVHELAAQAGAELRWNGDGFAPLRDERGTIARWGLTRLWACGDLCGYLGSEGAQADARRVADHLVALVGEEARHD